MADEILKISSDKNENIASDLKTNNFNYSGNN